MPAHRQHRRKVTLLVILLVLLLVVLLVVLLKTAARRRSRKPACLDYRIAGPMNPSSSRPSWCNRPSVHCCRSTVLSTHNAANRLALQPTPASRRATLKQELFAGKRREFDAFHFDIPVSGKLGIVFSEHWTSDAIAWIRPGCSVKPDLAYIPASGASAIPGRCPSKNVDIQFAARSEGHFYLVELIAAIRLLGGTGASFTNQ